MSQGEPTARRRLLAGFVLLVFAVLILCAFLLLEHRAGGFEGMRRYGTDFTDGVNWVSKIAPGERTYFLGLVTIGLACVIVLGLSLHRLLSPRFWQRLGGLLFQSDTKRFIATCCLFVFALTQVLSLFVFRETAVTDDEGLYLFQAKVFATGRLAIDSPPHREFFDNVFLINNGKMYPQYPPGNSLVLVPGVLLGHPSLIPSLLAALIVPLVYSIATMLRGESAGRAAALLACSSPFLAFTSATLAAGTGSLFFLTLALWAGVRTTEGNGGPASAFFSGAAGGAAFLIKPAAAVVFLAPVFVFLIASYLKKRQRPAAMTASLVAGGLLLLAVALWFNWAMNGHPLVTGYQVMWGDKVQDVRSPIGFGKYLWGIEHTPAMGLKNMLLNLMKLNFWLFGWPLSLALPIAGIALRGKRPWEWLFAGIAAFFFVFYFFYFWAGVSDTGPVLYYELLTPLILLSAAACVRIDQWLKETSVESDRRLFFSLLAAALIVSLGIFWQIQVRMIRYTVNRIEEPYRVVREAEVGRALVFMEYYLKPDRPKSWVAGRRNNSPGLEDEVLYVRDLGLNRNGELIDAYPDRTPYRFRYYKEEPVLLPHGPLPAQRSFVIGEDGSVNVEERNGIQKTDQK